MTDPGELLDIEQAARFLQVSETSLRRWTNSGRLGCLRVGRRRERRFRREDLLAFLEHQPAESGGAGPAGAASGMPAAPSGTPPHAVIAGVAMPFGTHLASLYGGNAGRVALASAFLADGLRPGCVSFLVADRTARRQILARLGKGRPSLQADLDAGRLVQSSYARTIKAQGDYWERAFLAATGGGARELRVVGDMRGMARLVSRDKLQEYEAEYTRTVAHRFPVVTLCMYDVRHFSSLEILNALKAHSDTFRYPAERVLD